MAITLRPMNLGEILDRTFQIYRSRFLVFLGIGCLPSAGVLALSVAAYVLDRITPAHVFPYAVVSVLHRVQLWLPNRWAWTFLFYLATPVFAWLGSRIFLGEEATLRSALQWIAARWQGWLALAAVLWTARALFPTALLRFLLVNDPFGLSLSFRIASPFVGFIDFLTRCTLSILLALSVPAWINESLSVPSALTRCMKLVRHAWIRVSGAFLLVLLLEFMLLFTLRLISLFTLRGLLGESGGGALLFQYQQRVNLIEMHAVSALLAPLFPIAIALIYYDQRIRREGYDIERMMEAAGLNPPLNPAAEQSIEALPAAGEDRA